MKEKENLKFKIINNNNRKTNMQNNLHKNEDIEKIILSAAKLNKNSEVEIYFKNIPANQYTLGYKKFCGIKIDTLVFYNPSLFELYPKLIDFIYLEHCENFIISIKNKLYNKYFSKNNTNFNKFKSILNTDLYINLDVPFDEIIKVLDILTESIFNKKVLKILVIDSIKK